MRGITLTLFLATLTPLDLGAQGVECVADRLEALGDYTFEADYEVTMPSFSEPVVYKARLSQRPVAADSLAPCQYHIEWTLQRDGGDTQGWSAYFDGNHYRMLTDRLQEYHFADNSTPFGVSETYKVKGGVKSGVQYNAQFADILPAFLSRQIRDTYNDSTYTYTHCADTIIAGVHRESLYARQRFQGYDVKEWLLVLDKDSGAPVRLSIENNPGAISEQSIKVVFTPSQPLAMPTTEEKLIALHPDDFSRYRQSTYKIESLPGTMLPTFTAKDDTGSRYHFQRGSKLSHPTIIALLDTEQGDPAATVDLLRKGVDALPGTTSLVLAFVGNDATQARSIVGSGNNGERLLVNCSTLARDCGVTATPVVILVDRQGMVKDVITGFNNDLDKIVIQKATLL